MKRRAQTLFGLLFSYEAQQLRCSSLLAVGLPQQRPQKPRGAEPGGSALPPAPPGAAPCHRRALTVPGSSRSQPASLHQAAAEPRYPRYPQSGGAGPGPAVRPRTSPARPAPLRLQPRAGRGREGKGRPRAGSDLG